MLVNGHPVKLRGACRHDNPSHSRTYHYCRAGQSGCHTLTNIQHELCPYFSLSSTERFLEFCDRYGIYVESETAVCFVDTYRQKNYAPGKSQDDSTYTRRYLDQCRRWLRVSVPIHPFSFGVSVTKVYTARISNFVGIG